MLAYVFLSKLEKNHLLYKLGNGISFEINISLRCHQEICHMIQNQTVVLTNVLER